MLLQNKPIIIVAGPTGTGKTDFAIQLGLLLKEKAIGFKIINFDSLCFYKELNIGTAKPTRQERQGLPHALIGHTSIQSPLNASEFRKQATTIIQELHQNRKFPILVGGSAFYIRALIKGMYQSPTIPEELHQEIQEIYEAKGIAPLRQYLQTNDINSFKNIHENDHYRTMRAVEYHRFTGQLFSKEKEKFDDLDPYDFSIPENPEWHVFTLYLDIPQKKHWEIIQKRAERILNDGLIAEVKELLAQKFTGDEKPLLSIGYKETQDYLDGHLPTKEALKERISISTRQLAKSQRTFFNKIHPKTQFNPLNEKDKALKDVVQKIQKWTW